MGKGGGGYSQMGSTEMLGAGPQWEILQASKEAASHPDSSADPKALVLASQDNLISVLQSGIARATLSPDQPQLPGGVWTTGRVQVPAALSPSNHSGATASPLGSSGVGIGGQAAGR